MLAPTRGSVHSGRVAARPLYRNTLHSANRSFAFSNASHEVVKCYFWYLCLTPYGREQLPLSGPDSNTLESHNTSIPKEKQSIAHNLTVR